MVSVLQRVWVSLVILVLLGAVFFFLGHWHIHEDGPMRWLEPLQEFFKSLGASFFIAIIIILTVEISFRKWHKESADETISAIKRNLFHAIYSRYIPEGILEQVEKCVLECDLSRTQYEITYEMGLIDENNEDPNLRQYKDDYLIVTASNSYVLQNLRGCKIQHKVSIELELPMDPLLRDYTKILSASIDGRRLSASEIDSSTDKTSRVHLLFQYEIEVKSEQRIQVEITAQMIKRRMDMEVWASMVPSDGLTLRVISPEQISVYATSNHFEKLDGPVHGPKFEKRWNLHHGIFPFQSVIFWWNAPVQGNLSSFNELEVEKSER